jgi:hypothetical protein
VQENRCLIAWVRADLQARTEAYRYALEHAFIAMPQNEAAEAERAVKALDRHRHVLDTLPHTDCSGGPTPHPVRLKRPVVAKG